MADAAYPRVHVVVNPASGKDEPVLNTLNDVFRQHGVTWDVSVTHRFPGMVESRTGQDLWPVAQRLQSRLVARCGDRRQRRGLAAGQRQRGICLALIVLAAFGVVGLVAAMLLPARPSAESAEAFQALGEA